MVHSIDSLSPTYTFEVVLTFSMVHFDKERQHHIAKDIPIHHIQIDSALAFG